MMEPEDWRASATAGDWAARLDPDAWRVRFEPDAWRASTLPDDWRAIGMAMDAGPVVNPVLFELAETAGESPSFLAFFSASLRSFSRFSSSFCAFFSASWTHCVSPERDLPPWRRGAALQSTIWHAKPCVLSPSS